MEGMVAGAGAAAGHQCTGAAPSMIPREPGERIKTFQAISRMLLGRRTRISAFFLAMRAGWPVMTILESPLGGSLLLRPCLVRGQPATTHTHAVSNPRMEV